MIISNSGKFIFVHAPKCGGTSVSALVDMHLKWNDIIIGGTPFGEIMQGSWSERYELRKHSFPHEIQRVMGPSVYQSYRKILVCRSPIDRFFSAFNFIRAALEDKAEWIVKSVEHRGGLNVFNDVEQLINSVWFDEINKTNIDNLTDIQRFFVFQSSYIDFEEKANDRFSILKLEDITSSTDQLARLMSLNVELLFPHANSSRKKSIIYDPEFQRKLEEIYSIDIALLGY